MKKIILCPYCESENGTAEISKKERMILNCFNCEEEIGELIPKILYLLEFFYFLLNIFIFALIIGVSGYFFENYPDWKYYSGFIFCFTLMITSVALHEFFHAFFAFILGDYTIFSKGYLRLNILKYFDSFGSFVFPLIIFFFVGMFFPGAAVFINSENIRYRISLFTIFLSGVFSQILFLFLIITILNSNYYSFSNEFLSLLHFSAFIQIILFITNILPIPGLDGWNALFALISRNIGNLISKFLFIPISIGFLVFVIILEKFDEEFYQFFSYIFLLTKKFGLNKDLIFEGFSYMQILDEKTLLLLKERLFKLISQILLFI